MVFKKRDGKNNVCINMHFKFSVRKYFKVFRLEYECLGNHKFIKYFHFFERLGMRLGI